MKTLIKLLTYHRKLYGEVPLTNTSLLDILKQTQTYENKQQEKQERFLDQLTAECTDPNG